MYTRLWSSKNHKKPVFETQQSNKLLRCAADIGNSIIQRASQSILFNTANYATHYVFPSFNTCFPSEGNTGIKEELSNEPQSLEYWLHSNRFTVLPVYYLKVIEGVGCRIAEKLLESTIICYSLFRTRVPQIVKFPAHVVFVSANYLRRPNWSGKG